MTSLVRNHDSSLLAVYILGGWHEAWKDTPAAPNFKDILDFNRESGRSWAVLISTLLIVSDISFGTLLVCQTWTLLEVQRLLQFMFFHAQIQEIEEINTGTAVPMTARYPIKIQQRLTKAFWQHLTTWLCFKLLRNHSMDSWSSIKDTLAMEGQVSGSMKSFLALDTPIWSTARECVW